MSSWRRNSHHLKRKGRRRRNCVDGRRDDHLIFLFVQFVFLRINGQLRQRFIHHSLHMSICILTISSGHPYKNRIKERSKFQKKKKREKKEIHILFSSRRIFLACILWVQVQGKDHISDEDPLGHQNRQSHKQNLRQLEPDLGNDSPNQDTRILQNRQQENNHVDEIEGISQKEKRFKRMHDEMGFPISVVTTGLHPKGHQTWFPIQIQKQRSIMIFNHKKKKGV